MAKFLVEPAGLIHMFETTAKNKEEAYNIVNGLLKGELDKIIESGGDVIITRISDKKIKKVV